MSASTIAEKMEYLNTTKVVIKEAIEAKGVEIADDATFRSYADSIAEIESGLPQQEKTIEITENGSYEVVPDEGYAMSKVTATVGITIPEPVVEALEIVENGTYTAPEGVDGYNPITVNVPTGGGGAEGLPESLVFSGNCEGLFKNGNWDWAVELAGDRMSTDGVTTARQMFDSSNLEKIPFDINIGPSCYNFNSAFNYMESLTEVPLIKGEITPPTSDYSGPSNLGNLFNFCTRLREIPYDYFSNFGGEEYWQASYNYAGSSSRSSLFSYCHSLRRAPDLRMLKTKNGTSMYSVLYYYTFYSCYVLDEIIDFPVLDNGPITSNWLQNAFTSCVRIKNMTFETNEDGSPKVAEWKNQTINFEANIGSWVGDKSYILDYNSGITADKEVYDDATYQALKNDPDWFATKTAYSRYNHDSAVATINSLPDTSAYLAANGGTNTIKLRGESGELTDGGAINTLTEEEIAVAAAKGWTVTLV